MTQQQANFYQCTTISATSAVTPLKLSPIEKHGKKHVPIICSLSQQDSNRPIRLPNALVRNWHNTIETITKLTIASYFPTLSPKQEWESKPIIRYTWSDTRPNKKQLTSLEIKGYHLIQHYPCTTQVSTFIPTP